MTIEIGLLFAAIAGIIGVITFVIGRQGAAKNDGERWGKLDTNMDHFSNDLKEIKATLAVNKTSTDEKFDQMRADYKDSVSHVHDRLDDHLRNEHQMTVPQRRKST